jgi:hypothetical protein
MVIVWKLAPELEKLRSQIDERWPKRNRASDGTIADDAHMAAGTSDHIPNADGIVTAFDITNDPKGGFDAGKFAEVLRISRDPRIKYVIFDRRIFSSLVQPWIWREYKGANPHTKHVHVSVGGDQVPWKLPM